MSVIMMDVREDGLKIWRDDRKSETETSNVHSWI